MSPANFYHFEDPESPPVRKAERLFVRQYRAGRRHFLAKVSLLFMAMLCPLVMAGLWLEGQGSLQKVTALATFIISAVTLFPFRNRMPRRLFRFVTTAMLWALVICSSQMFPPSSVVGIAFYLLMIVLATLLYPANRFSLVVFSLLHLFVSVVALKGTAPALVAAIILFTIVLMVIRIYMDSRLAEAGRLEFSYRLIAAPAHWVLQGAEARFADHVENFGPQKLFCVCLASGLRLHESARHQPSLSQLAMSTSEFYDLCDRILQNAFPRGNYFSEWISDEFCLTFYETEGEDQTHVVRAAADVALRLIAMRSEFARLHGGPDRLDVAMSSGPVILGFIGPFSRRKVTAIGDAPNRVRRIYGAARLMQMLHGPSDKLICDLATASYLGQSFAQTFVPLGAGQSVRDHSDRELVLVERLEPSNELGAVS